MTRRLAAALLACGLVLGCGKSNDPPTAGSGNGLVPKDNVRHKADVPLQPNPSRPQ